MSEREYVVLTRIATALEVIAGVLANALAPGDDEPQGCPHPMDERVILNGFQGYFCKACKEEVRG